MHRWLAYHDASLVLNERTYQYTDSLVDQSPLPQHLKAWHIPLPDSMGQVKLLVGQVDLIIFFQILYDLFKKKMTDFMSQASKKKI